MTKIEIINDIKSKLDLNLLQDLKNKYIGLFGISDTRLKYLEVDPQLSEKTDTAMSLNLHSQKRLKMLDISTGAGYFPYISRFLGHDITVTDEPSDIYDDMLVKFFNITGRISHSFPDCNFTKLPSDIGTFDMITAMSVSPMSFWGSSMWEDFIKDSFDHLNKNGILFIAPNYSEGLTVLRQTVQNREHKSDRNYVKLIKK